jgi:hypothetical protein
MLNLKSPEAGGIFFIAVTNMLEQQLINAFMKLTAKVGAGNLVRELIQAVDDNGNPKEWTPNEMEQAIAFINMQVERFGKPQAAEVVSTLIRKFELSPEDLKDISSNAEEHAEGHVRGLQ